MDDDAAEWMRNLYLGEARSRFSMPTFAKRHLVPWIPCVLRIVQIVFALVAFAVVVGVMLYGTRNHLTSD